VKNLHRVVVLLAIVLISFPLTGFSSVYEELEQLTVPAVLESSLISVCRDFNSLNSAIRDGAVSKNVAQVKMQRLIAELRAEYYRAGNVVGFRTSEWRFPLEGYGARAVGGGRRHGYAARGYDYFSGNRHGGHPSYDIFIRDRNQDGRDDLTGKSVTVLSMSGGVVVALERNWEAGSRLRGGKYLWVYDPANDLLVYYAHNSDIFVELGQVVRPGEPLATVGRSGWNASKKRSPTHLHLTVARVSRGGRVVPVKIYADMVRAGMTDTSTGI
jgi:murein DD-endopeptidase MepM/ murein hydrolase activator NlpD